MILVGSLMLGVLLRLGSGRSLGELARIGLRGETLLVLLLVVQALPALLGLTGESARVAYWIWVGTFPCLVYISWLNRRSPGMAMLAVGLTLNAAVIVANGGMPVAAQAVAAAKAVPLAAVPLAATDFVHVVASGATRLAWLADVIPLPGPAPIRATLSAGDCLLFAGVATFVAASTARLTPKSAGFTS